MILCISLALAGEPAPADPSPAATSAPTGTPAPPPGGPDPVAPAAAAPAPIVPAPAGSPFPPGFVPARAHPTVDPLMPQKYRSVPMGKYPCTVKIHVSAAAGVNDIDNVACDQDAFWALATAIVQWKFEPATQNGVPVDSILDYTNTFEVKTLMPRKHIVGFVGGAVSVGGAGWFGAEGRIHLGEILSVSGGVDVDQDTFDVVQTEVWVPTFRGDATISSRRRHFEHRGIYGFTIGGFGDYFGSAGLYAGFRGEIMTSVPGLSVGGDAGLSFLFTNPATKDDVGFWPRDGGNPIFPWLRASLIWYAPLPTDQFVVVAREQDPFVFEPIIPPPDPLPDLDGEPFPGIRSVHWSEIEPSYGETIQVGDAFGLYPPGSYRCSVRVQVGADGVPTRVRAEHCPKPGRAAAEDTVKRWRWPSHLLKEDVQAVFPAPIFVRRDDAELVPAVDVMTMEDGKAKALPRHMPQPSVYVKQYIMPEWTNTRPTGSCFVDVDLDEKGVVQKTRWASGEIEVSGRVMDALNQWQFYPVAVDGELAATRVRLSMCDN